MPRLTEAQVELLHWSVEVDPGICAFRLRCDFCEMDLAIVTWPPYPGSPREFRCTWCAGPLVELSRFAFGSHGLIDPASEDGTAEIEWAFGLIKRAVEAETAGQDLRRRLLGWLPGHHKAA
jgi:hypothetical protein